MSLLVTGAGGFVGMRLLSALDTADVKTIMRASAYTDRNLRVTIAPDTDYRDFLEDVSCVVHLAARIEKIDDSFQNQLEEFRITNVLSTLNLAKQSVQAGVKRFIFVSSIKVNGESTTNRLPFTSEDTPSPQEPYGQSKCEAEIALRQLSQETGLEVVIIRPPLVYGPDVKGNMRSLIKLVNKSQALPLGGINNSRSLVSVDNLVSLIKLVIDHPKAANQTFLVSDGKDLSTSEIITQIAQAMNTRLWLIPIPGMLICALLKLINKGGVADRLFGSLQVDISTTQKLLGWVPPISVEEGFKRMCIEVVKND